MYSTAYMVTPCVNIGVTLRQGAGGGRGGQRVSVKMTLSVEKSICDSPLEFCIFMFCECIIYLVTCVKIWLCKFFY